MNLLYNLGIALYGAAANVAALRSPKVKAMITGQKETFRRLGEFRRTMAPDGFDVWFHVASLGEFEQARPLIEALLAHDSSTTILLSFFSPSGYQVRHNFDPRVAVVYLPFDFANNSTTFLDIASPRTAVFVKYEFWGNFLENLRKRGIPTYLVSGIFRPGQIFFRPWGGMFRNILKCFTKLYVQDEQSVALLQSAGIDKVDIAGDTRFDRVEAIRTKAADIPAIDLFMKALPADTPVMVAGSSWPADEAHYIPWLHSHPEVRAIIAPHEFDTHRLTQLVENLGRDNTILFSEFSELCNNEPQKARELASTTLRYIIIDCFGLLSSIYRYADFAYIGGGFGTSIHNINEAAVYGIPVIFGPKHHKFNEAKQLLALNAAFTISSGADFAKVADRMITDSTFRKAAGQAARRYIESNLGASARIMKDIFHIDIPQ